VYRSLIATGYASLQLPEQIMMTREATFGCECCREETATLRLLKFQINGTIFEHYFSVNPYSSESVILGRDFFKKNHVIIDFFEKCFWKVEKESRRRYKFGSTTEDMAEKDREIETNGGHTGHSTDASLPSLPQCPSYPASPPAEPDQRATPADLQTFLNMKIEYLKEIEFGETRLLAFIDTGAQASAISEVAYQSIIATGYSSLQFPVNTQIIQDYFHAQRIKTRIVLEFKIDGDIF
jgi:hypothetical protein